MKLYIKPGACSLVAHILLEEIGLPYETEIVDLAQGQTASGVDYKTINPRGAVPAIELEAGVVLTQNPAILQHLGELSEVAAFKPAAGSLARARLQEALGFCGDLHGAMGAFFAPGLDEAGRTRATQAAHRRFGQLEALLPESGFWLGDYTQADAYVFVVAGWTRFVGLDLSGYPKVQALVAQVAARPATQAALKAEGLI